VGHLEYWFSIDHLARIRRYGLLAHLRFVFNFNVDRVVVNLHRELKDLPELTVPTGLMFRQADLEEPTDQAHWIGLVNSAYPDGRENKDSAQRLRHGHAFLAEVETFFLCDGERPIGTVSIGVFRTYPNFGGDARIAVDPTEQGRGLGRLLILFALHQMSAKGQHHAEAVITLMRETSIRMHFKFGFHVPPNRSSWKFDVQKRMWPVRRIVRARLERIRQQTLEAPLQVGCSSTHRSPTKVMDLSKAHP